MDMLRDNDMSMDIDDGPGEPVPVTAATDGGTATPLMEGDVADTNHAVQEGGVNAEGEVQTDETQGGGVQEESAVQEDERGMSFTIVVDRDRFNDERGDSDGTSSSIESEYGVEFMEEREWKRSMDAQSSSYSSSTTESYDTSDSDVEIIEDIVLDEGVVIQTRRPRKREHITIEYERLHEESDEERVEDTAGEGAMKAPDKTTEATSSPNTSQGPTTTDDSIEPEAQDIESCQMHNKQVAAANRDKTNITDARGCIPGFRVERETQYPLQDVQPRNANAGENVIEPAPDNSGHPLIYNGHILMERINRMRTRRTAGGNGGKPLKRQRSPEIDTPNKNPRMDEDTSDSSSDTESTLSSSASTSS